MRETTANLARDFEEKAGRVFVWLPSFIFLVVDTYCYEWSSFSAFDPEREIPSFWVSDNFSVHRVGYMK